ncbi:hypothetical protein C7974DRAFT_427459 [Boeremia exigua]|uniref:uncharacterized protein n=1 Tax=Boeremia exigua TaxID=749465 RepID=UPI001E8D2BD3|nr:uncharacterized protein C7974DRAFT_427459 [Boeremia exigua]KAH6616487.1 hypothetical protein C7974DRAFT_427459 [Boeremia exigua]
MRQFLTITAALAATANAQSASSLTMWLPGPANNPSLYSMRHMGLSTFPPVASIISSDATTTVFALGCPSSTASSSFFNGQKYQTCNWATNEATYSIISNTRHVLHQTQDHPPASIWWTCDYNTAATKMSCDMEISGDVNDNTDGPISGIVWGPEPDRVGNVMAFATVEVVTAGRFGELQCGRGWKTWTAPACNSEGTGGKGTMVWSVGSEAAVATSASGSGSGSAGASASQGSGSGAAATASNTGSGSAPASTGAAGGFGVDAVRLAALVGGAAAAVW